MRYKHYSIDGHVRIFDDLNSLHNVISNECEKSMGVTRSGFFASAQNDEKEKDSSATASE